MGIKDLLPSVADVMHKDFPLSQLKGKRVAVDASAWLHKAIFATAEESMDLDFAEHLLYVDFLLTRTRNFRLCGVEPVLVFDGMRSSLKADTNAKRSEDRHTNMEQGRRLISSMNKTLDPACRAKLRAEAIASFQKGMSVTTEVEKHAIAAMRRLGVTVVIAPYEADSQLAYLCHIGVCEAVLTEDSDIIVYSAICNSSFPILYKFNTAGSAQCIEANDIFKEHVMPLNADGTECGGRRSKFLSMLKEFLTPSGRRMFVQMCVLAGCDYSDSVHGVGLQLSQQAIAKFKQEDDDSRMEVIVGHWRAAGKKIPPGFLERAKRAEALFFYHPVYDPRTRKVVPFMSPRLNAAEQRICPLISPEALAALGSVEDLLKTSLSRGRCLPDGASIADICEGKICRVDFTPINPILPWEYPELAALSDRIPRASAKSASWSLRKNLMNILREQMHNRSPPNRNIPLASHSNVNRNSVSSSNVSSGHRSIAGSTQRLLTSHSSSSSSGDSSSSTPAPISLTRTTASLMGVSSSGHQQSQSQRKKTSPPRHETNRPRSVSMYDTSGLSSCGGNVPYSPLPQARRNVTEHDTNKALSTVIPPVEASSVIEGQEQGQGVVSSLCSTFVIAKASPNEANTTQPFNTTHADGTITDSVNNGKSPVVTPQATVEQPHPSPGTSTMRRAPFSEISASEDNSSRSSCIKSSPSPPSGSVKQQSILFTPQVLKTSAGSSTTPAPIVASQSSNLFLTEDTMWPAANANGNSQHSISPLDKVVDLSASPAVSSPVINKHSLDSTGVSAGEIDLDGVRKRKHAAMMSHLPPRSRSSHHHPHIPSVVQINADPRGTKRKKNGHTKTMSVASITSFFSVAPSSSTTNSSK